MPPVWWVAEWEGERRRVRGEIYLERGLLNKFDAAVELAEFVVAAARVGEDLDTIKTHKDVGACRGEQFLAELDADAGVERADDGVAKGHFDLVIVSFIQQ